MKLEFKQKQTEQLMIGNLSKEKFFHLAVKASNQLGWIIGNINETGFIAYTNNGLFSCNAEVKVKFMNGFASVQSNCREDDVTSVRENKKNIQDFISIFNSLKEALLPQSIYEIEKQVLLKRG